MDTIAVGKYLAQLRRERGMTQEQLGEQLGVTNKTISRWETGTYMPPVDAFEQLSALYGVSINELLAGKPVAPAEYRQEAERNLRRLMDSSSFTKNERFRFFKKKWERDHALGQTVAMVVIVGALVLCGAFWQDFLPLAIIAAFAWAVVSYNRMMAYIEAHLYPDEHPRNPESDE